MTGTRRGELPEQCFDRGGKLHEYPHLIQGPPVKPPVNGRLMGDMGESLACLTSLILIHSNLVKHQIPLHGI